jgi:tRNA threonylcarbamoyl adenosine modification protein (Sua5/YciO/YrdC/YwlC family)
VSEVFSCDDPAQREAGLQRAKESLARSGLVVLPTDTVYGIAADAFDPTAVRRLLRAKGRGRDMPPPVLIANAEVLAALATGVTAEVRELAREFWPGGLTLILRQQPSLRWDLGDTRGTVAVRVPDQTEALDLLELTGPLAVSSANTTGMPAATTVEEAQQMLADAVDVYLDAGPAPGSTASTIIDATTDLLVVRRRGVVSVEALRAVASSIEVAEPD